MIKTAPMKKQTILIIEDDALLGNLLSGLLASEGAKVSCCEGGDSALALSERTCFDVFVVGYRLRAMSGLEVAAKLRARCPSSRIIGTGLSPKGQDFLAAGADAFLLKPFETRELIALIEEAGRT